MVYINVPIIYNNLTFKKTNSGPDEVCCDYINITSKGIALVHQLEKLGNYAYHNDCNKRKSYKLEGEDVFLYYYSPHDSGSKYWQVIINLCASMEKN